MCIRNLYDTRASGSEDYEDNTHKEQLLEEDNITLEEVRETLAKLKNRKTMSPYQIVNVMLKYGGSESETVIALLFQKTTSTQTVSTDWKSSTTLPIYKKGNKNDPEHYRMISLLTSISSRQNSSTVDAIFILRKAIQKSLEYSKPLSHCLIDLKTALDRVRTADVIEILQEQGTPTP
ncbi:hypothetical protein Trydic_g19272 [Trypoxylus dichotomus]